ncbi:kinase-like protein [Daldinia sp. FL1419]|nr:kinase-like protein [Daldinia sp. FL1419]
MASISYNEILTDLYNQIDGQLEWREVANRRFAKVGTTQAVLVRYNLERLFCSLIPPGDTLEKHFGHGITTDLLVSRTEERCLHNFLATLIYIHCSIESMEGFVRKILVCPSDADSWPIYYDGQARIDQLPAERQQLQQILGISNVPDINNFINMQPCFCPIVLCSNGVQSVYKKKQRLPYISKEERIGSGSYGVVYRVVIAKGHFRSDETMVNSEPIPMARKDFEKSSDFQKEFEITKQILCTPRKSINVLETLASLQLDGNVFSLFMPLAECDLKAWMNHKPHPILESEKADFIEYASGVADGLEFLHSDIEDASGNPMVCFHMDLKPANILVFNGREPGKFIWKISDFGMSRVKLSHRHTETIDQDISVLFRRRGGNIAVSDTMNPRLDGTYLAPESRISARNMNEKSDVWSLGCVLSVVMTYITLGQAGINTFTEERAAALKRVGKENKDYFYLVSQNEKPPKSHPAIKAHHRRLIREANQNSSGEGKVMKAILTYIEEKVLRLEPQRRESSGCIRDELRLISSAYHKLGELPEDSETDVPSSFISKLVARLRRKRKKLDRPKLKSWCIPNSRAIAGCALASNEPIIAHWTDTAISLYDLIFLQLPGENKKVPYYKLREAGAWRDVKLNGTYLIASTTGHHSHIYLFDIKGGGLPGLNFDLDYKVELPVESSNTLGRIAISPGGETLACVVHQDSRSSCIYYAKISDLLRHKVPRRDSESMISSSSDGLRYRLISKEVWGELPVDVPVGSVTHLAFPSDKSLYYITQPDIPERHNINICYKSLLTGSIKNRHVRNYTQTASGTVDSSNWGRLLTTAASIDNEGTLATVLYENQLSIRSFGSVEKAPKRNIILKNYFVKKLLMDKQDSRLFALAYKSGNSTMIIIEILLHGSSERPQEIERIPGLSYGDRVVAALFNREVENDADGGYILIMAYTATPPTLYRVNLPALHGASALL